MRLGVGFSDERYYALRAAVIIGFSRTFSLDFSAISWDFRACTLNRYNRACSCHFTRSRYSGAFPNRGQVANLGCYNPKMSRRGADLEWMWLIRSSEQSRE